VGTGPAPGRYPARLFPGFNPRPKLQLAAALPLGYVGEAELLDIWLEEPLTAEPFARRLAGVLPDGLGISQVAEVPADEPSLPAQVVAGKYRVTLEEVAEPAERIEERVTQLLAAEALPAERRGKSYDLRPLIEDLELERVGGDHVVLGMRLAARPGATGRPSAVVAALELEGGFARYCRRQVVVA